MIRTGDFCRPKSGEMVGAAPSHQPNGGCHPPAIALASGGISTHPAPPYNILTIQLSHLFGDNSHSCSAEQLGRIKVRTRYPWATGCRFGSERDAADWRWGALGHGSRHLVPLLLTPLLQLQLEQVWLHRRYSELGRTSAVGDFAVVQLDSIGLGRTCVAGAGGAGSSMATVNSAASWTLKPGVIALFRV
jgi:hypothetical protein